MANESLFPPNVGDFVRRFSNARSESSPRYFHSRELVPTNSVLITFGFSVCPWYIQAWGFAIRSYSGVRAYSIGEKFLLHFFTVLRTSKPSRTFRLSHSFRCIIVKLYFFIIRTVWRNSKDSLNFFLVVFSCLLLGF